MQILVGSNRLRGRGRGEEPRRRDFINHLFAANMKPLLTLLCLTLLSGCGLPDIRLKRMMATSEVVGIWELDPGSSALAVDGDNVDYVIDRTKPHEILFRPDGTCRYRSVFQMPTRYVDAEGKWSIVRTPDDPKGSEVRLEINTNGVHVFSLDAKEDAGRLILWEFWGDPDLWNFLEYKRKDTEPGAEGGSAALPVHLESSPA